MIPKMNGTVDVADAVGSYYKQLFMLNPSGIVPAMARRTSVEELLEITQKVVVVSHTDNDDDDAAEDANRDIFYHHSQSVSHE